MNAQDFFHLVEQMREAQRNYFATHSNEHLKKAKGYEKEVDAEIKRVKQILKQREKDRLQPKLELK